LTLVTRWGSLRLGEQPLLLTTVDHEDVKAFLAHLESLGVDTTGYETEAPPPPAALADAVAVLAEARSRGYAITGPRP
jgi:hypothetical protein